MTSPPRGKVFLVGAGPGDPGLITLRGIECLRQADLILYDYLVNPRLLEHTRPAARKECLGRHGQGRILSQAEINAQMVDAARSGETVVRLKAGDPIIFARAAEEIDALTAAGVPLEIVPGITAAFGAGSYAGIPLTMRDQASAVALVTGHECADKQSPELDFAPLAKFPGTLVVYMGVTSAPRWVAALIAAGKSPTTPAAIVRRCSWPDQRVLRTTLEKIPAEIEAQRIRPPVIVVVGEVTGFEGAARWFSDRPLFGQRILVTRALEQIGAFGRQLEILGAEVVVQPAIEIGPARDQAALEAAVAQAGDFDWLVFSSANGVRYFFERFVAQGYDARRLAQTRLAVMGPGTRAALAEFKLHADVEPDVRRAEALADALASDARGKRFLLVRASRGREVLAERLTAAGGQVTQVVAYE
ncbi:MAG: uroporphyrinogen-III C-methyltransferase, partial [Planctomycetaceae bacterium]|nr:uroporphyrinogen-III C-methyltransferase [Planctomycetaceae bacterium]